MTSPTLSAQLGIDPPFALIPAAVNTARNESGTRKLTFAMGAPSADGCVETSIVSRERARQIIAKLGIKPTEGGRRLLVRQRRDEAKLARNQSNQLRYGVAGGLAEIPQKDLLAYRGLRNSAKQRRIHWDLSFPEWREIWLASGHINERGTTANSYCLARIEDELGFVKSNLKIVTRSDFLREVRDKNLGNKLEFTGVSLAYPGLSKPYSAYACHKFIGYFATAEEAVQARAAYIDSRLTARSAEDLRTAA